MKAVGAQKLSKNFKKGIDIFLGLVYTIITESE